jgi:HEAT repeat protein
MHPILCKLKGGDRRSIGRAEEVVSDVLENPALFKDLIAGLAVSDALVRMRAADAMEKVSLVHPEYLRPYKAFLMEQAALSDQKEVRWHLAQVLPRLRLSQKERRRVIGILRSYFSDRSSIVKTFAMQALADIAGQSPALRPAILLQLRKLTATGTPAMQARGRKLLAQMVGVKNRSIMIRRKGRPG